MRLYDVNTFELTFMAEMYLNFAETYKNVSEKFFNFPLVKTVIGIEFANLYDAKYFKRLVQSFSFKGDAKQIVKEERRKYGLSV